MQPADRVFRSGNLTVDCLGREARLDGVLVNLRPKTFDLLVYLIANHDRVLSKEDLIRDLWNGAAVSRHSPAQCVIELRKTLGDDSKQQRLIRTVAGAGYRWVAEVEAAEEVEPAFTAMAADAKPLRTRRTWIAAGVTALVVASALLLGLSKRMDAERAPARNGEVAWWKLDEGTGRTIRDSVGGRTAALPGGVSFVPGRMGNALRFDGTSVFVHGENAAGLPAQSSPHTLAAWFKTDSTNGDSTMLFQYGAPGKSSSTAALFLMLQETGRAAFGDGYVPALSHQRVDDGAWHQMTGVIEGSRTALYVDGAFQSEGGLREALHDGPMPEWSIGRALPAGTSFRGMLDDVRVYERALRPAEVQGLFRCSSGAADVEIYGSAYYFTSLFPLKTAEVHPRESGETSARARNAGRDLGGVAFTRRESECAIDSMRSADIGQDLNIAADLRVPVSPSGDSGSAGPYFRSRRAAPGDGIAGGTSAGFWVQLLSTGQVRVKRLLPLSVVSFSAAPASFDASVFHHLEVEVVGDSLEAALDGKPVEFEQEGRRVTRVHLEPAWEKLGGKNEGSAGIAFGPVGARDSSGAEEARNIQVTYPRALRSRAQLTGGSLR